MDLAFQLDGDGLRDAWIVDHDDVPFSPLTCFSGAVYEIDWAGMSAELALEPRAHLRGRRRR